MVEVTVTGNARDVEFLQRAVMLARAGSLAGDGGPFGAVIVRDGVIVGEGWNRVIASKDPTAHAEIEAIRAASQAVGSFHLDDCDLYTSCEPCPMCLAAACWARVRRIVYACRREDAAAIGFCDAELYDVLAGKSACRVPLLHLPLAEGQRVMQAWAGNPARTGY